MTNLGRYNASNEAHTSSLFAYGEVPVESAKLNRWDGNIAASLEVLNRVIARLANRDADAVLDLGSGDSLRVACQSPCDMSVRILPGLAVIHPYAVGRTAPSAFPEDDTIPPPVSAPRIDVVYLRQDGEVGLAKGMESITPAMPAIPEETLALAEIYLRPGCTSILESDDGANAYLVDIRPLVTVGETHRHAADPFPQESADGTRVDFSTVNKYRTGTLDVFVNGVLQAKDIDYTEKIDARGYTFLKAPPPGAIIQHRYILEQQ